MENTTSNRNCLNMLSYTSILKQTVGKYIQNYHWTCTVTTLRTQSKTICTAAVFQPYALCCKSILMKCMRDFWGVLRRNRNISSYYETYTFSINCSFLICTFNTSSSSIFLSLPLVIKVLFLKDRSKKYVYILQTEKKDFIWAVCSLQNF